jgi:O-antigen/teichoic acid export membrane protein
MRGLSAVGIFGQARLYNSFLASISNTIGHNVWGISLAEARNSGSQFTVTRRVWAPIHVAIVVFGLVFAFVGREIVDLLTNGKLTLAAIYIPILAAVALIQNSGKAATAVVFAGGLAPAAARLRMAFVLLSLFALYPAVSAFGIGGVVGLLLIEAFAYRVSLRILAGAMGRLPWQDDIAVAGVITLIASSLYVDYFDPPLSLRIGILAVILMAIVGLGHRILADVMTAGRDLFNVRSV